MTEVRTWPNFLMLTMKPTTFEFYVTAKCFASIPQQRWKNRRIRVHFRHDGWHHPLWDLERVSFAPTPSSPKNVPFGIVKHPVFRNDPAFPYNVCLSLTQNKWKENPSLQITFNAWLALLSNTCQRNFGIFFRDFLFVLLFMIYVINRNVLFL